MIEITSKTNDLIKDLVRFRDQSKFRDDKSLFYVEGERIVKDIPHELVDKLFVSKDKIEYYYNLINSYKKDQIYVLDNPIFDKVKDTVNSQGIIALVKYNLINEIDEELINCSKSILFLDNISDPGNLGTIIRLAEAANISLIILSNNCCNIYNTKVIRSCMSSIFRKKIYISKKASIDLVKFREGGYNIYSTFLDKNAVKYTDINYRNKSVIILGNEANGVCSDLINYSDKKIYIPMCGQIESLNVSIAATVICYEIMRQNSFYEA